MTGIEHLHSIVAIILAAPVKLPAEGPPPSPAALSVAAFISQIKVNGFVAFAIQKLKENQSAWLAWINHNSPGTTRVIAALAASLTAVGIHWTFTGSVWSATGLSFTVTGVSAATILTLGYNIAQNYLCQHGWYKLVFSAVPKTEQAVTK